MTRRIAFWALAGLAVALTWALAFYILGPSNGYYPSQGAVLHSLGNSAILQISAPVALLGRHYAITWYWSSVINAAMYACAGMLVEMVRLALRARPRLRH